MLDHQQRTSLLEEMNEQIILGVAGSDILTRIRNPFTPSQALWMKSLRLDDFSFYIDFVVLPENLGFFLNANYRSVRNLCSNIM